MTPAEVRNSLITGNREMDEEHALQLQLLRELMQNLETGDGPAALEVFERLEQFTNAHFLAEELLMRLHSYPGYEAHGAEHAQFVEELGALRTRLAGGEAAAVKEDADAFARRLLAHIATADHALGEFERSGGA
ncbi:MAG: hemerythrin family protein, partial [Thermoanaerobaculia bacterium]|nr:hemerythrin family protein [Thermoanaerobaculia bacterium]